MYESVMVKGHVLELGCGVGLLGILIASLQNSKTDSLEMTDVSEAILNTCQRNVLLPRSRSFKIRL